MMSALERELEVRRARFEALQKAMREWEDRVTQRFDGAGYAYMAGFLTSQLMSLASDRADSTEDLIKALSIN